MKWILTMLTGCFIWSAAAAQDISVKGVVMEQRLDGTVLPIEFANVYWQQTNKHTVTDSTGYFFIQHGTEDGNQLIIQYLGYDPDTIIANPGQYLSVVFKEESNMLGEVVVTHHRRTTEVSFLDPLQMQNVSKEELFKAACCNLSESFETNATVDVSFTDAITGAKEIQMLGLSGKYTLISQEQVPALRGLAIPFGLLYTPGPWIESIQISKGSGSVLQGYESMTGQINVELKKPFGAEKFLVNGFYNESGRAEGNVITRFDVSPKLHTVVMGHYSIYPTNHDRNGDGFTDMPTGDLIDLANHWDYHNEKSGVESQLGIHWLRDEKVSGTTSHGEGHPGYYRAELNGERLQLTGKLGYVFHNKPYNSFGSQWGYTRHTQNALIGKHIFNADQTSLYGNWMYRSIFGDTRHQYFAGVSLRYDNYNEALDSASFDRKEVVPGVFIEYTYKPSDKISIVAGLRADHHNLYDWLITPRLHLRYAPVDKTVFRISIGKGYRSPLPIVENLGILASSRVWQIGDEAAASNLPFNGLKMENAWTTGASLTQEFKLDFRSAILSIDFYRTMFTDRTVVDQDASAQQLLIYNLDGKSYANTFQAEMQWEILKRLDLKIAYKWQDSKLEYRNQGLREQIFTPRSRFFVNGSYQSSVATYKGHWRLSATAHYTGEQRIPDTEANPAEFQLPDHSPGYWLMNGQLTRVFKQGLELYFGAENIFNYKQSPVIVDAAHPESAYFDSSLIWGPIFGREWYVGFRYAVK